MICDRCLDIIYEYWLDNKITQEIICLKCACELYPNSKYLKAWQYLVNRKIYD